MKFQPNIDKNFKPFALELDGFEKRAAKDGCQITICVERNGGYNYIYNLTAFSGGAGFDDENYQMTERLVKFILWAMGGYKVYIAGSDLVGARISKAYKKGGEREFDALFMQRVYEKPFEVIVCKKQEIPKEKGMNLHIGGNLEGCRIGFDAGGSDRKVSAVIDGEAVYSEEVIWHPKVTADPNYHYSEILAAMKTAASKMPRVDAIGVSSAGIYVDNRIMAASLFLKVPDELFDKKVKNMYLDIAKELGVSAIEVANDGDVTALAGAMELKDSEVLGIAMGTSQAGGYINSSGGLNGWLNELAFVPVDLNPDAMIDEWSGDIGCGVKYFSQDGVIKLANMGGFEFEEGLTPAEKLKVIQNLHEKGDDLAQKIFEDIGIYLAYSLPLYAKFYGIKHVLLLGRVTSGKGGDVMLKKVKEVLAAEFPNLSGINITMPDENNRRVGQSIAAASLPKG